VPFGVEGYGDDVQVYGSRVSNFLHSSSNKVQSYCNTLPPSQVNRPRLFYFRFSEIF
jgi:hypothetical protein